MAYCLDVPDVVAAVDGGSGRQAGRVAGPVEPLAIAAVVLLLVVGFQSFAYYLRWRNRRRERERGD